MKHSDLEIRKEMFEILCEFIKDAGLWDKVKILNGNYYDNFIEIGFNIIQGKNSKYNKYVIPRLA